MLCYVCAHDLLISISACSSNGLIEAVGPTAYIKYHYKEAVFDKVLDATGMCVLPGKYLFCSHLFFIIQMITTINYNGLVVNLFALLFWRLG